MVPNIITIITMSDGTNRQWGRKADNRRVVPAIGALRRTDHRRDAAEQLWVAGDV